MEKKRVKVLNIVLDEKFIDDTIERHEIFQERMSCDYIFIDNKFQHFKYIKKYPERVKVIPESEFLSYLKGNFYDAIFLHSLGVLKPQLIVSIPKSIKVFWFAWGYDIYTIPKDPFIKVDLYGTETKKVKKTIEEKNVNWKIKLKSFIKEITFYNNYYTRQYYKAISRIDYFSGILDYEFYLMQNIPAFRAKKVNYRYCRIKPDSTTDSNLFKGKNILIGNSADYSNNHLDILKYFKNINLGDSTVFVPLSYSGNREYVDCVKSKYSSAFGENFVPLENFMSYQEYYEILNSCSVMIFAHERQQAMGNIYTALKMGCKVYLSETNKVFSYYKNLGVTVFSIQKDLNQENINKPLTDEQIMNNKKILSQIVSRETYFKQINHIIDCISAED